MTHPHYLTPMRLSPIHHRASQPPTKGLRDDRRAWEDRAALLGHLAALELELDESRPKEVRDHLRDGRKLLADHEAWAEDIRRCVTELDPVEETRMKDVVREWLSTAESLQRVDLGHLGHLSDQVQDLLDNWKTPRPYILKSMRQQVITGDAAKRLKEILQRGREQRQ